LNKNNKSNKNDEIMILANTKMDNIDKINKENLNFNKRKSRKSNLDEVIFF
jgi:hypothetical protein